MKEWGTRMTIKPVPNNYVIIVFVHHNFFLYFTISLSSTIVMLKLITIMNNSKLDAFTKAFAQMLPIRTIYHCHVSNAG